MQTVAVAFIVIAVLLCAYAFVYRRAQASLSRNAVNQVEAHVSKGRAEIEAAMQSEIPKITRLLRRDPSVISLRSASSLSSVNYAQLITLRTSLQTILPSTALSDSCLTRLFLLFDAETPFICSTDGIYHDVGLAVRAGSIGVSGQTDETFLDFIRSHTSTIFHRHLTPVQPVRTLGATQQACFYIVKLSGAGKSDVYAVLQISVQSLFDTLLSGSGLGEPAALYNSNGDLLYEACPVPRDAKNGYYDRSQHTTFLRVSLDNLGAEAVVHVRDESVFRQIREFTYLLYLLLFLFIALLIMLFGLAIVSLIYPMQRINSRLEGHGHSSFDEFESEFQRISENLSQLKPALRTSLLDKLLHRDSLTPAERAALQTLPDLPVEAPCRMIVVGADAPAQDDSAASAGIEPILGEFFNASVMYPLSEYVFAILQAVPTQANEQALRETLDQILLTLQERMPSQVFAIGVSRVVTGANYIHSAFEESQAAFNEQLSLNQGGIRFYQEKTELDTYSVSLEELDHLFRLLNSGADESACGLFDEIVRREFGEDLQRFRDASICRQFFSDIRGILLRLSGQHDLSAIRFSLSDFPESKQFSHVLSLLRSSLYYAASMISGKQEASENDLARSIQLYLQEGYADPSLSLTFLADLFDMSESSMSRFFKAHMGTTFSAYLENIRLSEAEILLSSSMLPVKDISSMVGYTTTTTFYKAFRRKWGVSPTTYRENAQARAQG